MKLSLLALVFSSAAHARFDVRTTDPCSSLPSLIAKNATALTINIVTLIRNGSSFQGDSLTDKPAHCRIAAQFATSNESTVNFELWLPVVSSWNERFLATGNGGWAGAINYPDVSKGLKMNFATMSMNGGHNSSSGDGSWLSNPEESIDYGHRALHLSVAYAKTLVTAYYSTQPSWSYYMGCSTGGRQGFAEVQRYPTDSNGVLVGCPVIWQTHLEV